MGQRLIRLLPILLPGLALLVFLGLRATRPEAPRATPGEQIHRVTATTIEPTTLNPEIILHARVEAPRETTLSAAVNADVRDLTAREGMRVATDAELLTLDTRELDLLLAQRQADVDEITAQIRLEGQRRTGDRELLLREQKLLALAEAEVQRAEELLASRAGSRTLLDQALEKRERQALALTARQREVADHPARLAQYRARLKRATALRDQALLDLQRTRLLAPFAGRITRVLVAPGDRVRVGDPLLSLHALEDLELRAQLPLRHLPTIRQGLDSPAGLVAETHLDHQPLTARLLRLGGETSQGGVDALFQLDSLPAALIPGRLLTLRLILPAQRQAVALPISALYQQERIYRLQEGRLEGLRVERLGEQSLADTTRILVRSPRLRAGDRVLTTQLPNALTGLKVMVLDDQPPEGHALATGD